MQELELMIVLAPVEDEVERKKFLSKLYGRINSIGKLEKADKWGLKRLAYEMLGYTEGYYYLLTFQVESCNIHNHMAELDNELKRSDICLRHMIIRKGE